MVGLAALLLDCTVLVSYPRLHEGPVAVRATRVAGTRAVVQIELRNTSPEALELPLSVTLRLAPATGGEPAPSSTHLFAPLDPNAPERDLGDAVGVVSLVRLPVGGSKAFRLDLHRVKWFGSTRLNVWFPRPLSEMAEYDEYEFQVAVQVETPRDSAWSRCFKVRAGPE